jgi:hemerythrin superfamily protein
MEKPTAAELKAMVKRGVKDLQNYIKGDTDIISVIKEDHVPLKELIKVMKDDEQDLDERIKSFEEFVPLLLTHAKAEEKALYETMKTNAELRGFAYEGGTEHDLADQLCEEIKRSTNRDEIGAKIKVLAELVEHHVEEEENDIFPEVKKRFNEDTLQSLMLAYIREEEQFISEGQTDSPSEQADVIQRH